MPYYPPTMNNGTQQKTMNKKNAILIWLTNTVFIVIIVYVAAYVASKSPPKTQWINDTTYVDNLVVLDDELNKTLPTNATFFYTKTLSRTNNIAPQYFYTGFGKIELGAREDGVIVWRKTTNE